MKQLESQIKLYLINKITIPNVLSRNPKFASNR